MSEHDNTNRAAAFPFRDNQIPILQGRVNIDGDDSYVTLVKTETKKGTPIIEVYQRVGTLWPKKDDHSEKAPDWSGPIGDDHRLGMWSREKNGMRYLSGLVSSNDRQDSRPSSGGNYANKDDVDAMADIDDEVPF